MPTPHARAVETPAPLDLLKTTAIKTIVLSINTERRGPWYDSTALLLMMMVKELKLSYYIGETLLFIRYIPIMVT